MRLSKGKYLTIDKAIANLQKAKAIIGGDKCLILSLWDSELQDVNVNGLTLINDNYNQYVQVDVTHPDLS